MVFMVKKTNLGTEFVQRIIISQLQYTITFHRIYLCPKKVREIVLVKLSVVYK